MGLHRHNLHRRIRPLTGAIVAVVLVLATAAVVARHAWVAASARQSELAKTLASGLLVQSSSRLSTGPATATPSISARPTASPSPTSSRTRARSSVAVTSSPPGSVPGWRLVYSQDFNGSTLPAGWTSYGGGPRHDPYGHWNKGNVVVSGGELHIFDTLVAGAGYETGGVKFHSNPQTYGMYLVRMKGDYEPGLQISDIALLWPNASVWPPEIDFFEDKGGTRSEYLCTVHPGPNGNNSNQRHVVVANNATQWHTYGVEWTPTTITFTVDGHPAGSAVVNSGLPAWPNIPMNLALQSENKGPAQPSHSIETMTVDWVAEYAMT